MEKEDRYTDLICRRFCRFFKEGREEMQCGTYFFLKELFSPEDLEALVGDIPPVPDFSVDAVIRGLICNKCDFLVDGCDYREGLDSPPCGGYLLAEHLFRKGE